MRGISGQSTTEQKRRGTMTRINTLRNLALILVFVAVIFEGVYLARFTGFTIIGNETSFTDPVNISFNQGSVYHWNLTNQEFESLKSIKINGNFAGNGVA